MLTLHETLIEIPGVPLQFIEIGDDGTILASAQENDWLIFYHFNRSGEMFFSFKEKMYPGESYEVFRANHFTLFYRFKGSKTPRDLISMTWYLPKMTVSADMLLSFPKLFENLVRPTPYGPWYEPTFDNNGCYEGNWLNLPGELPNMPHLVYKNSSYGGWMSPLDEHVYNIRLNTAGGMITNLVANRGVVMWQREGCLTSRANSKRRLAAVSGSRNQSPAGDSMYVFTFDEAGRLLTEDETITPVPGAPVIPISMDDRDNMFASVVEANGSLTPYFYGMTKNDIGRHWWKLVDVVSADHRTYVNASFGTNPSHPATHPSGVAALQPVDQNDGKILVIAPVRTEQPFIPADLIKISEMLTKDGWVMTIDNLVIPLPNGKRIRLRKVKSKAKPPKPGSLPYLQEHEWEVLSPETERELFGGVVHMLAGVAPTKKSQQLLEEGAKVLLMGAGQPTSR